MSMELEKIVETFGFDPKKVGLRHRGFWVVDTPDEDDEANGVVAGDLIVKARDGASNEPHSEAEAYGKFKTTFEDSFDSTYRYYVYSPLTAGGME